MCSQGDIIVFTEETGGGSATGSQHGEQTSADQQNATRNLLYEQELCEYKFWNHSKTGETRNVSDQNLYWYLIGEWTVMLYIWTVMLYI